MDDRMAFFTAGWQCARLYDEEKSYELETARMYDSARKYFTERDKTDGMTNEERMTYLRQKAYSRAMNKNR